MLLKQALELLTGVLGRLNGAGLGIMKSSRGRQPVKGTAIPERAVICRALPIKALVPAVHYSYDPDNPMRRPHPKVTLLVVLSLLFVRLTGAHFLLNLDALEPTTTIIPTMHVVSLLVDDGLPPPQDSDADSNVVLSIWDAMAEPAHADPGLALIASVLIVLAIGTVLRRVRPLRAVAVLDLSPDPHIRPPLRAPPL